MFSKRNFLLSTALLYSSIIFGDELFYSDTPKFKINNEQSPIASIQNSVESVVDISSLDKVDRFSLFDKQTGDHSVMCSVPYLIRKNERDNVAIQGCVYGIPIVHPGIGSILIVTF